MEICESEKITPERALDILKKDYIEVTLEEAKFILEFFYQMADIVVEQYLKKQVELPEYF